MTGCALRCTDHATRCALRKPPDHRLYPQAVPSAYGDLGRTQQLGQARGEVAQRRINVQAHAGLHAQRRSERGQRGGDVLTAESTHNDAASHSSAGDGNGRAEHTAGRPGVGRSHDGCHRYPEPVRLALPAGPNCALSCHTRVGPARDRGDAADRRA